VAVPPLSVPMPKGAIPSVKDTVPVGRARSGRVDAHRGGEGHRLAEDGRIRQGRDGRGRCGLYDRKRPGHVADRVIGSTAPLAVIRVTGLRTGPAVARGCSRRRIVRAAAVSP